MPTRKPKKPCRYPGCSALTDESYCPEHKRLVAAQYNRYERTPEMKKRYNGVWPAIRRRYIAAHPLCEMCRREGRITPAAEVHHILPVSQGGTNEASNLMALCQSCHTKIHIELGDRKAYR